MIYDNMLLYGIAIIIFQAIIMIFLPYYYLPIIYAITNLIFFPKYNSILYNDAKYKIYKICAKTNDTDIIKEKIIKLKSFDMIRGILAVIFYTGIMLGAFFISDITTSSSRGRMVDLYFNYASSFTIEANVLHNKSNTCNITFNYSNTLELSSVLNYYGVPEDALTTKIINDKSWNFYESSNRALYTYTYFNDIYFILTENINNVSSCSKNIGETINSFIIMDQE